MMFSLPPRERYRLKWGIFNRFYWGFYHRFSHGTPKRIYAFVMVLGYSRMIYVEFTEDEKLDTFISCHLRVFEYFGGRPEVVLYDNMETMVSSFDERGMPSETNDLPGLQPITDLYCEKLLALPRKNQMRQNQMRQNQMQSRKRNPLCPPFWPRVREFTSLDDLNRQVRHWLDTVANVRVHGTTHHVTRGTAQAPSPDTLCGSGPACTESFLRRDGLIRK
jgi:hypothetical protein